MSDGGASRFLSLINEMRLLAESRDFHNAPLCSIESIRVSLAELDLILEAEQKQRQHQLKVQKETGVSNSNSTNNTTNRPPSSASLQIPAATTSVSPLAPSSSATTPWTPISAPSSPVLSAYNECHSPVGNGAKWTVPEKKTETASSPSSSPSSSSTLSSSSSSSSFSSSTSSSSSSSSGSTNSRSRRQTYLRGSTADELEAKSAGPDDDATKKEGSVDVRKIPRIKPPSRSLVVPEESDTDLLQTSKLVSMILSDQGGLKTRSVRWLSFKFTKSFTGLDLLNWLERKLKTSVQGILPIAQDLLQKQEMVCVSSPDWTHLHEKNVYKLIGTSIDLRSPESKNTHKKLMQHMKADDADFEVSQKILETASRTLTLKDILSLASSIAQALDSATASMPPSFLNPAHSSSSPTSPQIGSRPSLGILSNLVNRKKRKTVIEHTVATKEERDNFSKQLLNIILRTEDFLELFAVYRKRMEFASDRKLSIREIFHRHMAFSFFLSIQINFVPLKEARGPPANTTFPYALSSASKLNMIISLLRLYLDDEGTKALRTFSDLALELLGFLENESLDCYSCMLGLTPSEVVINKIHDQRFMKLIGFQPPKPGSLMIAKIDNQYCFCRYNDSIDQRTVRVIRDMHEQILHVEEKHCFNFPTEDAPFSELRTMQETNLSQLERFVENTLAVLLKETEANLKLHMVRHLAHTTNRFRYDAIVRAFESKPRLSDYQDIVNAEEEMRKCSSSMPKALRREVKEFVHKAFQTAHSSTPNHLLFLPTLSTYSDKFLGLFKDASKQLKIMANTCARCADKVKQNESDILNGTRKEQMIGWWHDLIHEKVRDYLGQKGFLDNALPDDYIGTPPAKISDVESNLALLSRILNIHDHTYVPDVLIESLKNKVYPVIEEFLRDSRTIIAAKIRCSEDSLEGSAKELKIKFKEVLGVMEMEDPALGKWVENTLEDIDYLSEMKRLEDPEYARSKHSSGVSHIIPISGLVITQLVRLENEHKTAIEQWGYSNEEQAGGVDNMALQHAILKHQHKTVEALLIDIKNGKKFDINMQDRTNRWTVLHCASSEGDFNLCKKLLKMPKIDVNVRNRDGNTALHYLVKAPKADPEQQCELVRRIVEKGCNIDCTNLTGETPLHGACYKGKTELAKTLLQAGADPNALTKNAESCLHYAVRSQQPQLVSLLMSFGANYKMKSVTGVTAMDVALSMNNPEMIAILRDCIAQSSAS